MVSLYSMASIWPQGQGLDILKRPSVDHKRSLHRQRGVLAILGALTSSYLSIQSCWLAWAAVLDVNVAKAGAFQLHAFLTRLMLACSCCETTYHHLSISSYRDCYHRAYRIRTAKWRRRPVASKWGSRRQALFRSYMVCHTNDLQLLVCCRPQAVPSSL